MSALKGAVESSKQAAGIPTKGQRVSKLDDW